MEVNETVTLNLTREQCAILESKMVDVLMCGHTSEGATAEDIETLRSMFGEAWRS